MSEQDVGEVCRYCDRELPFEEAREYHEKLHEEHAWEEAYAE